MPLFMELFSFSDDESLVGVFGRAGPQTYYKRDMINNIGFVFFNDKTDTVRTVGVSTPLSHSPSFRR